jgi:pyruvate/2-oxoglutarate dehydrogenase complex dihydrolipoamide acyltransferase (E2) component
VSTTIRVEDIFWEGNAAGVIGTWYVSDGESVAQGALVVDVMYEKAQIGLESPATGRIHILLPAGAEIHKGDVIATID